MSHLTRLKANTLVEFPSYFSSCRDKKEGHAPRKCGEGSRFCVYLCVSPMLCKTSPDRYVSGTRKRDRGETHAGGERRQIKHIARRHFVTWREKKTHGWWLMAVGEILLMTTRRRRSDRCVIASGTRETQALGMRCAQRFSTKTPTVHFPLRPSEIPSSLFMCTHTASIVD
jgi:hypothetical protein